MFITKTMNESTDLDIQGFDLIDSICESYEDLLNLNEALAHFDIKEQKLIHTESADLDAFREDALEKAKEMLNDFITKLKVKYHQFLKWVNKQVIKLFNMQLDKYLSKNKDRLNKAITWYNSNDTVPAGKANKISTILHKAVIKDNHIVPLADFIEKTAKEFNDILDDLSHQSFSSNNHEEDHEKIMQTDIVKLFKEKVEKNVGKFEAIVDGDDLIYPLASFNDFNKAISLLKDLTSKDTLFKEAEEDVRKFAENTNGAGIFHKFYNWRYVQFTKLTNAHLSLCRKYFMMCVFSASSIIRIYESNHKE